MTEYDRLQKQVEEIRRNRIKKIAQTVTEEVYSYYACAPGGPRDCDPSFGVILCLVEQGLEKARKDLF